MPPSLLLQLRTWADTQSLLSRMGEGDVTFKAPFARKLLTVASQLARWTRQRSSSVKALGLAQEVSDFYQEEGDGDGPEAATAGEDGSSVEDVMDEDTDQDAHGDEDADDNAADDSDAEDNGGGAVGVAGVFGLV